MEWSAAVTLIWPGCLVMMAGGTLSLLDRRRRVGAPARTKLATAGLPGASHAPLCCPLSSASRAAAGAGEALPDAAQEARARAITSELRCMVCQNQSIDDSDADLARDLRRMTGSVIIAGDCDDQVIDFVVSRYGEFGRTVAAALQRPQRAPCGDAVRLCSLGGGEFPSASGAGPALSRCLLALTGRRDRAPALRPDQRDSALDRLLPLSKLSCRGHNGGRNCA